MFTRRRRFKKIRVGDAPRTNRAPCERTRRTCTTRRQGPLAQAAPKAPRRLFAWPFELGVFALPRRRRAGPHLRRGERSRKRQFAWPTPALPLQRISSV